VTLLLLLEALIPKRINEEEEEEEEEEDHDRKGKCSGMH
jgi:hypothetical protein